SVAVLAAVAVPRMRRALQKERRPLRKTGQLLQ
ncbi:unnamed protein product, partial [marine sediment metagenome]